MADNGPIHDFEVVDVTADVAAGADGVAVVLRDVRGGRVRLHLSVDMAEKIRQTVSSVLDHRDGP